MGDIYQPMEKYFKKMLNKMEGLMIPVLQRGRGNA